MILTVGLYDILTTGRLTLLTLVTLLLTVLLLVVVPAGLLLGVLI